MAGTLNAPSETVARLAGIDTLVRRGGSGTPLLVIHGELGVPGWLESYSLLGQSHDVIVPSLPGYGASQRPDWIMSIHDLAAWITWFARDSGIDTPVNVIGCSMGAWAAVEIATVAPHFFGKLVLTGPMGIKPSKGEIFDYFLENGMTGLRRNFHQPESSAEFQRFYGKELSVEETDIIEQHREMTCRMVWKPYMHSLTLHGLLPAIRTPTLIVQGSEDKITPLDCGAYYANAIPGARHVTIAGSGHAVEMEKPQEFAGLVREFLNG